MQSKQGCEMSARTSRPLRAAVHAALHAVAARGARLPVLAARLLPVAAARARKPRAALRRPVPRRRLRTCACAGMKLF